jgi:hypothetical protein
VSLDRAPGERYLPPVEGPDANRTTVTGRAKRPLLLALLTALAVGAIMGLAAGLFDIDWGLIALGAIGGWLIGTALLQAGGGGRSAAAVALAVLAFAVALVVDYLASLAALQESVRPLSERVAETPFVDWLGPQLGPAQPLTLLALGVFAWRAAR